jgi:di/tricarboxylate transporter
VGKRRFTLHTLIIFFVCLVVLSSLLITDLLISRSTSERIQDTQESGSHIQILTVLIVTFIGTSPKQIVLGFMLATGFLSMWVSNTVAVMMMIPIGTAITY